MSDNQTIGSGTSCIKDVALVLLAFVIMVGGSGFYYFGGSIL